MPNFKDLTGKTFGKWTVTSRAENLGNRVRWNVQCQCGEKRIYRSDTLKDGRSQGCQNCMKTHGLCSSSEYGIWSGMKKRCYDTNHKSYPHYGGRGIKVCDKWKNDFAAFYSDMGPRPSLGHSIDRIDGNGHYAPDNCRWATSTEQNLNYSQNRHVEYQGKNITVTELAEETGIERHVLYQRLDRGYSVNEAISKAVNKGIRR